MKKKKKPRLPLRMNLLFFIVFLVFTALVLRLGIVQIVHGENYRRELERKEDVTISNPVPRGKIYDRNENVIVDNMSKNAIIYTRFQGTKNEEIVAVAEKLAKLIDKDTAKVKDRDLRDYWLVKHPKKAKTLITKKELKLLDDKKLEQQDVYRRQVERVPQEEINKIVGEEREVVAIFREMISGYALTPQIVKSDGVTPKEYAVVSEHLEELPGVDTTTDWDRSYTNGGTLRSILGNITSSEEGLPAEKFSYYMSRGYSRNDRVGKSYLEQQYESVLRGQKSKVKNIMDKAGNRIDSQTVFEGKRGDDLVLTIDMDLQKRVEKIIEEELLKWKRYGGTELSDRAYVVMMNPKTGEILSMAGKVLERKGNKFTVRDDALGTMTASFAMGSSVKGATVLTGYQTGAISPGYVEYDAPMKIKGTPEKSSWKNMGRINDLTAIEQSSNVYMFKTAIKIGGGSYGFNQPLFINPKAFTTMRNYFGQFGLGTRTWIDLPNEVIGWPGQSTMPGFLLDYSIGQFDTYTTLQLAQYVSTIANDGYRMQPHIVKEIRQPNQIGKGLGPLVEAIEPRVLNRVSMKQEWIERVQKGFRLVYTDGTARRHFANKPYTAAGKTGTAQAFYDGPRQDRKNDETWNLTLVGYAPYENPEVAFAIAVPWAYQYDNKGVVNKDIGARALDTYFELKKKRQKVK